LNARRGKALAYTTLLAALVAVAAWRWLGRREALLYPDTPESATEWMCTTCAAARALTARQTYEWLRDPQRSAAGASASPGATPRLLCETCRTFTLERAQRCARHDRWHVAGCPLCPEDS